MLSLFFSSKDRLPVLLALILLFSTSFLPLRQASATTLSIAVTTSRDYVDGNVSSIAALQNSPGSDKRISLREAMLAAEATAPGDEIQISFNMPASITDTWEIYLKALDTQVNPNRTVPLPTLRRGNITIDASTQPGSAPLPRVFINGFEINEPNAGDNIGFRIASANNTIRGLGLINFYDTGIVIEGSTATGNIVSGCMIGASPEGLPNLGTYTGIQIRDQASNNRIGGPLADERNMIIGMLVDSASSKPFAGIHITGSGTQNNSVSGSWIGFWPDDRPPRVGSTPVPEPHFAGIYLDDQASQNRIGGEAPNIIAGNSYGIYLNGVSNNVIAGNIVGLAPDGSTIQANRETGIMVKNGAQHNIIGGTSASERNVVSGNNSVGIMLRDAGTDANKVLGNYVGLSSTGLAAAPNKKQGIVIQSDTQNTQIGDDGSAANYVAANLQGGILVQSSSTLVKGNLIGLAVDGATALGNALFGIDVPVSLATIGPNNVVSNNGLTGIRVSGDQTTIVQNVITTNANSGLCLLGTGSLIITNTLQLNGTETEKSDSCGKRSAILVGGKAHIIRANTIHSNQLYGITVNSQGSSLISLNSISNNTQKGILLETGANDDLVAPIIMQANYLSAYGQACPGCIVEVFADPNDQGLRPLGSTIASADGSFTLRFTSVVGGINVTATNTNINNETSAFGNAFALPELKGIYLPVVAGK